MQLIKASYTKPIFFENSVLQWYSKWSSYCAMSSPWHDRDVAWLEIFDEVVTRSDWWSNNNISWVDFVHFYSDRYVIFWQTGLDSTAVLPLSNVFPSRRFQAMDRLLFAGLLVLSVSSFTAHASSSRPHIIFILADDLVSTTRNFQTKCPGFLYKYSCMRSEGNWKAHNVHFSHLFWPFFWRLF